MMSVIVCVNQGNYLGRGADYVRRLRNGVFLRGNVPDSCRFVCLDDCDGANYHPSVESIPLPPEVTGWWSKLYMFKEGLFPEGEQIIYFDLDTAIVGDIRHMLDYAGELALLNDFYQPRYANGMMLFRSGFGHDIWNSYVEAGCPTHLPLGDLTWTNNWLARTGHKPDVIQQLYPEQVVSYKKHVLNGNYDKARVICFHGKPRPHETNYW